MNYNADLHYCDISGAETRRKLDTIILECLNEKDYNSIKETNKSPDTGDRKMSTQTTDTQERTEQQNRQNALKVLAAQLKALADFQEKAIDAIGK